MTADCLICRDSLNLRINSSDPRSGNISRTGQTGANRNCRGKIQGTQSRARRRRRVPVTARLLWLLRERGSRLEKKMKSTESQAVCGCETWPGRYRLQVHQRSSVAQHQSYLASLCHSVERIPMVTPHGVFNLHVTPVGIATEGGGGRSRIGGAASCGLSASGIFLSHFHRALPRLDLWRMGNPAFPNGCVTKILPSDKRAPVTELILRASSHLRLTGGRRFVLQWLNVMEADGLDWCPGTVLNRKDAKLNPVKCVMWIQTTTSRHMSL